mmetsp:Transcript_45634/g.115029  ORF Transcript_45634/g.115029 Transcript_45634/m.115029 type:complete len:226 (-) Transcript_45634:38-715(-)
MADPSELAALSGSAVPMEIHMDGSVIGPGTFGSYDYFVQEGDVSADSIPASEAAKQFGVKGSDGKLSFVDVTKIKEVVPASDTGGAAPMVPAASADTTATSGREQCHRGAVTVMGSGLGDVLKEGELEKHATAKIHLHPWQRRVFHLHKAGLAYFTEKECHQKLIPTAQVSSLRLIEDGARSEVHLVWSDAGGKSDTHRLRAATNELTKEWHDAMAAAWGYSSTE